MNKLMKVGITGRLSNALAVDAAKRAIKILEKNGTEVFVDESFPVIQKNLVSQTDLSGKGFIDALFSFGGDGTFLRAARTLGKDTPLVGVNCGRLGFLLELKENSLEKELPEIIAGNYYLETRTRLEAAVDGEKLPLALNEVAIVPKLSGRLVKYAFHIDDWFSRKEGSDGLIVATPTGSTGHSLSAGGPIIVANSKVFVITSINPIDWSNRPTVVNDNSTVKVNDFKKGRLEVIIDGQERFEVEKEIIVKRGNLVTFLRTKRALNKLVKIRHEY